jgi:hypothetical protein
MPVAGPPAESAPRERTITFHQAVTEGLIPPSGEPMTRTAAT